MQTGTRRCVSVDIRNGDIEGALRLLKRKLKKDNFFRELQAREYYLKPSVIKKLKRRRKKTASGNEI